MAKYLKQTAIKAVGVFLYGLLGTVGAELVFDVFDGDSAAAFIDAVRVAGLSSATTVLWPAGARIARRWANTEPEFPDIPTIRDRQ